MKKWVIVLLLSCATWITAFSQENSNDSIPLSIIKSVKDDSAKNTIPSLEINGLIVDETRTKSGREFYRVFYKMWEPPPNAPDFMITIKELPGQGRGSRVQILVNRELVFLNYLQPRSDYILSLAQYVDYVLKQHLKDLAEMEENNIF
ncbi:CsgE family curli-type amyloid fiber assembly protein [Xanthovirga aplysinae]|uniref:CsgE family curli-type amyloid fiber assembly protein n=1 Tax=Xanthovirga aplysinae TaxID=2529853 RepID=UPI0012BD32D1|nr:CsgE family curli-type amyloid fiber assembly protein [Xanthovirga aplysinae]MTI30731.1 hypothetical protein [Xanthovirga aplysinae]